ncbi:MAG: DUF5618 family protein [Elusimicrobiota bacterium]
MKKIIFQTPEEFYREAIRYYRNAKERLRQTKVVHDRYKDLKPVREACALGYLSTLLALDGFFLKSGLEKDKLPVSIDGYWKNLRKYTIYNGKIIDAFSIVYENLHIFGYYRGASDINVVKSGFEKAYLIIKTLSGNKF